MTALSLLQGVTADSNAAYHTSYPINLEPTLVDSGISKGYLTNAPGVETLGTGPGPDRGAIPWRGVCYRVMGSNLVRVDATGIPTILGDVQNNGAPVSFDYSFDRLAIASNGCLFYWDGSSVTQVTDPDLGTALDILWIDGYFMTTDGESLVVTELNDPYSVDPLKYGSAEEDPDPIVGLKKVRGEVYAIGTNTIQNFQDLGTTGFPFSNNPGGLIPKGAVGTHAISYFLETFAFVGNGRNEAPSVYLAGAGTAIPISTSEMDQLIAACTVAEQAAIQVEARTEQGEQRLYVHLPTKTLVYMHQATQQAGFPVWHVLTDGAGCDEPYSAQHMAFAYDKWIVGSPTGQIGALDYSIETHFDQIAASRFDTVFLYNGGLGFILNNVNLVGLPGRTPFGSNPTIALSFTQDGQTWSDEQFISMGKFGERQKRLQWRPHVRGRQYMGLRIRAANTAMAGWASIDVDVEGLAV